MPFPFHWVGAAFAAVILGAALTLFALAMVAIDRAATEARGSILPGLVGGLRGWARELDRSGGGDRSVGAERSGSMPRGGGAPSGGAPDGGIPGDGLDDLREAPSVPLDRLHPHLR